MRTWLFVLLLVLPFTYAASDYIAAVSEHAPASAVVFAANFAAVMKQQTGVEFTGMTDRDLYNENSESLDGLETASVVLINSEEKYAIYIRGADTSSKHRAVETAAIEYLEDKGYDVVRFVGVEREGTDLREYYPADYQLVPGDLLVQPLQKHDLPEEEGYGGPVRVVADEPEPAPVQEPEPVVVVPAEQPAPVQEPVAITEPASVVAEPEEHGTLVRFFAWLTGLFS